MQGKALTEEELDKICQELQKKDIAYTVQLEEKLKAYRKIYGPLESKPGEGKIKNNEETRK